MGTESAVALMHATELLLLDHADRRLHLVPVDALRSAVLGGPGHVDPDRPMVECTALPSGQVIYVLADEIRPHALPDDAVSAVLTRFAVTGLRPANSPMLATDRRTLPMFGNLADPTWLSLSLGGQCGSKCVFCYTEWIRHEPKLTFDQAVRALDEAISIPTVEAVVFTGGEPTIRKDLPELVRHASKQGYGAIGLQTNGHLIANPLYLNGIVESGVTNILLSLHGARPETHDRITRHRNSFTLALRALKSLAVDDRVMVEVNFVVCVQNAWEVEDLIELISQVAPAATVRYSFPIVEGAAYDNAESTLPSLQAFVELISGTVSRAAGGTTVSVANVPACISSKIGLANTYTVSQRRSMLAVSPFASSRTLRGEVSAKLQVCGGCRFSDECDGLQLAYLRRFSQAYRHVSDARDC
ncbi:radical SAM protein [Actinomadura rubrisoli]|uniref:Radical SAM protein n=1 Tax=Actinomadura rubrisoli TaxID=2530368 RepID=A0A4R5B640_9ACTN|nr:radical SAM protein [Actinomadura rubrisoli]TDD80483.1 radical SAM protein [Actinomadura rubrisoli]